MKKILISITPFLLFIIILLFFIIFIKDIDFINNTLIKITQEKNILSLEERLEYNNQILKENFSFLEQEEHVHMLEVFEKFSFFKSVMILFVGLLLIDVVLLHNIKGKIKIKKIKKDYVRRIFILDFIIITLITILSLILFPFLFTIAHRILFRTPWIFPKDSLLINIYPFSYFCIYFALTIILSLVSLAGSLFLYYKIILQRSSSNKN